MRRVVLTGVGGITPLGSSWGEVREALWHGRSGVISYPLWTEYEGLRTELAAPVREEISPETFDRKRTRTMGRTALLACRATERALEAAKLTDQAYLSSGNVGIAYGSCLGGPEATLEVAKGCLRRDMRGVPATSYVKVMSHSCAANLSLYFQVRGRIIPTCSACTSASQAIGFAYETIRAGYQEGMIAGGAEELCIGLTGLFDSMFATSTKNSTPSEAPSPFDEKRDGLVVSEGACTFFLESLDRALYRKAPIVAEVVGFATNSDGNHITTPEPETMQRCLELSLQSASLSPRDIGFVHAHATGTELGDIAESRATAAVFGFQTPIGALKSYFGHTLGAAGAIEAWCTIEMMREGWFAPILNLHTADRRCAPLDFIVGDSRRLLPQYVMSNNFAFGGVNTSLIFKRWDEL
jgi:3-oxoacyl-[acyl-carrier-protein] synthase II